MTETSAPADRRSRPWWADAVCWQVYPLGFTGAPKHRADLGGESYGAGDGENVVHRLPRLLGWLDHLVSLGANVLVLNPVFDSVSHGYDTLDHHRVDPRLGDVEDLDELIAGCHQRGVRVVLDGVFNHLSAQHPLVRAAVAAGPDSEEGAVIRWSGEHPYGFEGNEDLVELDLSSTAAQDLVVEAMGFWLDRGVDGWRLDAMYAAGGEAWRPIIDRVRAEHPEAWILGEVIHGDYPGFASASGADSITQYELWKAIWSSLRDHNLFELTHALGRHQEFRDAEGGAAPLVFLGNHDTTRIASQLTDGRDLAAAVALLALLPGVPAIYAGDEFGATGVKEERAGGDDAVRPVFPDDPAEAPAELAVLSAESAPRLLEVHRRLLGLRRREPWLAGAAVSVHDGATENTYVEIVLHPAAGADTLDTAPVPLVLAVNLGEEDRPAPGEVLEQVSGADVLDGVGPPAPGTVPAHGVAVVR